MGLLSLLGDEHLQAETTASDPLLTAVATRRKRGARSFVSVILAYGNETRTDEGTAGLISVVFRNMPEGDWKFLIYQLDNVRTNPYQVWKSLGQPVFPDRYGRRKMREVQVGGGRRCWLFCFVSSAFNTRLTVKFLTCHSCNSSVSFC